MPLRPAALRRAAALAACFSLSPTLALGASPSGPFAEPPPGEPVEPSTEPPPDDEPPRRREVEIAEPSDEPLVAASTETHPLVISLVSPISTNAGRPVETYLEINALYGQISALHGVSVGTFSRVDGPAWGLRLGGLVNAQTTENDESGGLWLAGLSNFALGDLSGLPIAGVMNRSTDFDGVAIAGGGNLATGLMQGGQLALGANSAKTLSGLQVSGLFNHTAKGSGGQVAFANLSEGEFGGLQLGALDLAFEDFGGAQIGAINYADEAEDSLQIGAINAAREVEGGLQVGAINYARRFVRGGLQFGLINVASRGEGTQVGLVSVSERLAVEPVAWGSWGRSATYAAGLRLRNGAPYSQLFFAYAPSEGKDRLGGGAAIGTRLSPEGPFFVDLDAAYTYLARADQGDRAEHRPAIRASIGLDVGEHFGVFVGASGGARLRGSEARSAFEGFAGLHF